MTALGLLRWSLQLDFIFLFKIPGLALGERLRFVLLKYLIYLKNRFVGLSGNNRVTVFGRPFYYNDVFGLASLQRVYCASYPLKLLLPAQPVVLDVGANVGQFNFFCSHYLKARKVVSIEPIKECYELLKLNATCSEHCLNSVVGEGAGDVLFHVCANSSQLSSYLRDPAESYRESYWMASQRLDDLLAECDLDRIDLLKVDTEGSEFDVLASGEEALTRSRYLLVEMSIFRECAGNLFKTGSFVEAKGFELVELMPTSGNRPLNTDALFQKR